MSRDFVFVIDTCKNLEKKDADEADLCDSEDVSQESLNTMLVKTKIHTQFWNTKNFLRNGWEMNPQWQDNEI
jgi:hypothetical protein